VGEASFLSPVLAINPVKMLNVFQPLLIEPANYRAQHLTAHGHHRAS